MTKITGIDIRKAILATRGKSSPFEDQVREVATQLELDPSDTDFNVMVENILHNLEDPDFDNFNE